MQSMDKRLCTALQLAIPVNCPVLAFKNQAMPSRIYDPCKS
ncbi:MAG TPA: hypothetical protein VMY43_08185 [Methanothrix sp.]|nr:hypothetical protein [Methanothrix sp.]